MAGLTQKGWLGGALIASVAALLIMAAAPSEVSAAPRDVTGGYLDWGVKGDFRNYIENVATDGVTTLSGGATLNGDGTFRFPTAAGSHDPDTDDTTASFNGTVQFQAHNVNPFGFVLDLTISDIRMEIDGTTGVIIADVVSRDQNTLSYISYPDVDLVTLDLTSTPPVETQPSVSWANIPSDLTAAAAPAFGGFYSAGEDFDPASPVLNRAVGYLTWKVSNAAWSTSGSLTQAHATDAPAEKDPLNGFVFPTNSVSYNTSTHVTAIDFDGALILGNTTFGDFKIKLDNPQITIDSLGEGQLEADVSYCPSLCAMTGYTAPALDTTVTTFDYNPAAVTVSGGQYTWTITPDWASVGNQFAQEFLNALDPGLQGFFKATGAGSDVNKPPAPITITFDSWICGTDADCDGFDDVALGAHTGPANANPAADNCLATYNYAQVNTDGNFVDNPPSMTQDDTSVVMSDANGDLCDGDDDNDGLTDVVEVGLPGAACLAATAPLNPLNPDSDGDAYVDAAECALGTDPASAAAKPTQADCATLAGVSIATDTDGDRLQDRMEVCGYGSSTALTDSDGDGRRDGCEGGSLNTLPAVNSGDQLLLSQAITADLAGPFVWNADINKDGANNSGDQLLLSGILTLGGGAGPCAS